VVGDPSELEARIETLLDRLASRGDGARDEAEELVAVLVELYGTGLARVVALLGDDAVRLAGDELVSALLVLHGVHPLDVDARIGQTVERLRSSTGFEVEYLGVDDAGVARFRTDGNGHGCGSSTSAIGALLETAVMEVAPEVTRVDIQTPPPPPVAVPVALGPTRSSRASAT
jgi:Fe-S cluster biogenesis protein NfuA